MTRVSRASVAVDGSVVAEIGAGLLVLLGVAVGDTDAVCDRMAAKVRALRVFADGNGRMNEALGERGVLCVSQFTLYGDTSRGRRPSWQAAAPPAHAEPLVTAVVDELRRLGANVATGRFRSEMAVELVNDGPVTVWLEV